MKKWFFTAGLLVAMSCAGIAQAEEQATPPAPPPAVAGNLQAFVGHWTGTGKMKVPGQEEQVLSVTVDCSETAGGTGILCQDVMTGVGVNYLETDIIGYDARSGRIRWFSITSSGEMHDYSGEWKDEKKFAVNYTGKIADRTVSVDLSMALTGPSGLTVQSAATVEGQQAQSMTATLSKSEKP